MATACYPLASPPTTIRLWIGVHPATAAPAVGGWEIDGVPVPAEKVKALRPMQSVRSPALLSGNSGRAFTGVYEICGVTTSSVTVSVTLDGEVIERRVRPLPERLELDGDPLNVLLISCFDYSTYGQLYGEVLPRIVRGADAPHLTIFMGDQVYLDLPTIANFEDDPVWLANKFERDYVRNWFSGAFSQGLGLAAMAFVPDDHEYWNNYPHASPFIQNSLSTGGKKHWREAARACYAGFQWGLADPLGTSLELNVKPLSFMLVDSRTERDEDLKQLLSPVAARRFADWAVEVARDPELSAAVVVTGQSLLEDPVASVKGAIADYALANYEGPYKALVTALATITDSGKPVLLLTGDVHWGRVTSVRDRRRDTTAMHEVISSPTSLVATIGADQVSDVTGTVKSWFGAEDPWPRHAETKKPPAHLPHSGQRFRTETWWSHRGNQCAMLRIARRGSGTVVDYTFHPLVKAATTSAPPTTGRFELSPIR
jgi:hypothetical protein